MEDYLTLEQIVRITENIRARIKTQPSAGIILGSGLGSLAESDENAVLIPYQDLPFWPVSTVPGHQGRLVIGKLENKDLLVT